MKQIKSDRVTARVSPRQKRVIEAAAEDAGETTSSFVCRAAYERARDRLVARDDGDGDREEEEAT